MASGKEMSTDAQRDASEIDRELAEILRQANRLEDLAERLEFAFAAVTRPEPELEPEPTKDGLEQDRDAVETVLGERLRSASEQLASTTKRLLSLAKRSRL